jgi:hypothetical protein
LALTSGSRLGVYQVAATIGEGGMGQVFRASDEGTAWRAGTPTTVLAGQHFFGMAFFGAGPF